MMEKVKFLSMESATIKVDNSVDSAAQKRIACTIQCNGKELAGIYEGAVNEKNGTQALLGEFYLSGGRLSITHTNFELAKMNETTASVAQFIEDVRTKLKEGNILTV